MIDKQYDVVVIGGGISGVCSAIAAARGGVKVALIQNRPVLGGNASSEIRMHICGADNHGNRPNARETGILEEILLEHKKRNKHNSFAIFDMIVWEKVKEQENLDLYLNTHISKVVSEEGRIVSVYGNQLTTEKVFSFCAPIFVDATGDATIACEAGAEFMIGREAKETFGEAHAPEQADNYTMGNTLMFKAIDKGETVEFIKPKWANTYTEEELKFRDHSELTSGYWWVELGGGTQKVIEDGEEIRDELLKAVYGVWDHIKNGGDHKAENLDLEWVGFLPGKRDSRRVVGDYVLTEQDCVSGRIFEDAVAYGGWPMDMHIIEGFRNNNNEPTEYIHVEDVYTIPYRSLYAKNIENLFIGGRAISASHMAFGSTRVMGTCAVVGQAIGTAASMCIKQQITPRQVNQHIQSLQQQLLKDDCYIPGFKNEDSKDKAKKAKVICSTEKANYRATNVVNGIARTVREEYNCWKSVGNQDKPEWIELKFEEVEQVREVQLKLDSNLSKEIMISISDRVLAHQERGIPKELLKNFKVSCYNNEEVVHQWNVENNYQRFVCLKAEEVIICTSIKVECCETNGIEHTTIYEIRVY